MVRDLRESLYAKSEVSKPFSLIAANRAWFVSTDDPGVKVSGTCSLSYTNVSFP